MVAKHIFALSQAIVLQTHEKKNCRHWTHKCNQIFLFTN